MPAELTTEQRAKIQDTRRAAAVENGVRARVARRTLRAAAKQNRQDRKQEAEEAATKAREREDQTVGLWDADGDGDIDELDAEIIAAYAATTKSWADSGEDTWLRHVEMAENPEVYMLTQGGTVQVNGEDVNLSPDNPEAVEAFRKLHQDQADEWRRSLDAAQEELQALLPIIEDEEQGNEQLITADEQLDEGQALPKRRRKRNKRKERDKAD